MVHLIEQFEDDVVPILIVRYYARVFPMELNLHDSLIVAIEVPLHVPFHQGLVLIRMQIEYQCLRQLINRFIGLFEKVKLYFELSGPLFINNDLDIFVLLAVIDCFSSLANGNLGAFFLRDKRLYNKLLILGFSFLNVDFERIFLLDIGRSL